ncbi:MAG: redoxin family protein, partial [Chitinophagales bacterium]
FSSARILVVIFTCNHCATAQSYEDRIIRLTEDYKSRGVATVAIMPNDPASLRLDELDFSDLGDSYEEMKTRAAEKKFNFPYLYDGETQVTSNAYGPQATPHVFIFDQHRILRYRGRIDDTESIFKTPKTLDTRNALEALLKDQDPEVNTTKVFGCSIKWAEKKELVEKYRQMWANEAVSLDSIDETSLKEILKNNSSKLRLIYFWTANCTVCSNQIPEFVTINRMYRDRDFELVSMNAAESPNRSVILELLRSQQASYKNYFLSITSERLKSNLGYVDWKGNLPLTVLVEPGGKIVYAKQGAIDPPVLKKTIIENHLLGRYP